MDTKERLFIEHSIHLSIEKITTNISVTRRLYGYHANNLKNNKSTGVRTPTSQSLNEYLSTLILILTQC